MSIPTTAIFGAEGAWDPVQKYYSMFPHEVSETKDVHAMDIVNQVRLEDMTFELLLDTLTQLRTSKASIDTYLLVMHGMHDKNDVAKGLTIPLAADTSVRTFATILEKLLFFLDNNSSASDMANFESNTNLLTEQLIPITLPNGLVSRLVGKMRTLQRLKVRKVEFRACTLGNQPDVMDTVGRSFGARFIYAPDVHMFYVHVNPGTRVHNPKFAKFLTQHQDARSFKNGTDRLAIQVQGKSVMRITSATTTSTDLHWFTDSMIWPVNNYPKTQVQPATFEICGMDVPSPLGFALPLDPVYSQHLKFRGPLKGNQI